MSESCGCDKKSCQKDTLPDSILNLSNAEDKKLKLTTYSIPDMDCAAEEQIIRMALSTIQEIHRLTFNLAERQLKVLHTCDEYIITDKLKTLDMGAQLDLTQQIPQQQQISLYYIPKMDCHAEEQIVRLALANVNEIQQLNFDLNHRQLEIVHQQGLPIINTRLEALDFGAQLIKTDQCQKPRTFDQDNIQQQRKTLQLLLLINGVLFFIEFISGIIASSTGLIADSLDMFADAAVYGIALYVVGKAAKYQLKAAHLSGWIQLGLACMVIFDVIRRFLIGSEPQSMLMIGIGLLALIANITCLLLLSNHKENGAHMKASWIFSANDVIVNLGVIIAGGLVYLTESHYPDLLIGMIVSLFVLNGARKILALK
ncbi:cation transporter [Acinetobacter qingfengensis]